MSFRAAWLLGALLGLSACLPRSAGPDASFAPVDGGAPADAATPPPDAGPPRRALFIGNSYTYQNDLPALVRALGAATPGGELVVEMLAQGGYTLGSHWLTSGTPERVADGGYDFVVLQGQSLEAVTTPQGFDEYAMRFADAVHGAGAQGVWFATWARRQGDPVYSWLGTTAYMTYAIEERYRLAAALHDDALALAGAAFQLALAELPTVALHTSDGSHPTAAGSLLAACAIFHAMTGLDPIVPRPAPLGLPIETARTLCALATRAGPSPKACPPAQELCGDECAFLSFDFNHCGACNNTCPGEEPCRTGACGCDPPLTACARGCHDLETSTRHCGACGAECAVGETCEGGDCRCSLAAPVEMTADALGALSPECTASILRSDGANLDCRGAAHTLCVEYSPCFTSGIPPPIGHSPFFFDSGTCLAGDLRATTYAALQTFEPSCDGAVDRSGQPCLTAISRYCHSLGAESGWGPVLVDGDDVTVVCLPGAVRMQTTELELGNFATRCNPDAISCQSPSRAFCEENGYASGFGPVESDGIDVEVICLPW